MVIADREKLDATEDGRNVDPAWGTLSGEGAAIEVETPGEAYPLRRHLTEEVPSHFSQWGPTYYDQPALKAPVWIWTVPAYFWVGGATGAILAIGAAADRLSPRRHRALVRWCRRLGASGTIVSAGLLIADLGRPARFLNMLRVFRPTSPMSVGAWLLAATGGAASAWWLLGDAPGVLGSVGKASGTAAGVLGPPLAGYTAVLLTNTAVPFWADMHRSLPAAFVASAVVSATGVLELVPLPERDARIVRRFGVIGKLAALVAERFVEREVSRHDRVARPLHEGVTSGLWRASTVLTAVSLGLTLGDRALAHAAGRKPGGRHARVRRLQGAARVVGGLCGALGSMALRWAVFQGGKRSARDPRAVFEPQRAAVQRRWSESG